MMPLALIRAGEEGSIKKVGGKSEARLFLERLGFVQGARVKVITESSGGVIVQIKDAKVAVSREMAMKIII